MTLQPLAPTTPRQNWEHECIDFMANVDLVKRRATPCMLPHRERGIRVVIHGDDFTLLGKEEDLNWFKMKINDKFEVKFRGRMGPCPGDDKSVRILNRVVEWRAEGIAVEPDQRHIEIAAQIMGLEESKGASAPGVKEKDVGEEGVGVRNLVTGVLVGVLVFSQSPKDSKTHLNP